MDDYGLRVLDGFAHNAGKPHFLDGSGALALVWALTAVRHRDELKMERIERDFR
jgi:hypothetical protein